jgi:hypothetical protein
MLASIDCDKTPAVEMNSRNAACVTIPASPMVNGRGQSKNLCLIMTITVTKEVFHAPDGDSAIFDVYKNMFLNL